MKSKQLTINGVNIIAHSDGSITKPFHKRNKRTFGCKNNLGYMQIIIGGKTFKMHRINAQAFLPDFSTLPQVDHIDNVKWNNNITNLRMTTNQLNQQSKKRKRKGLLFPVSRCVGIRKEKNGRLIAQSTIIKKDLASLTANLMQP